jgi:hypothetical protein
MIRNPLSARHRKSPGRVNLGFISWRVRGAGARVAPSVFSFDTNSTHAIWPVPRGLGFFSPTAGLVQLGRIIPEPNRDSA